MEFRRGVAIVKSLSSIGQPMALSEDLLSAAPQGDPAQTQVRKMF